MTVLARWAAVVGAVALLPLARPSDAAAQDALSRVDELARAGRADEARERLEAWWDRDRDGASRADRQRALWLRAVLTADAEDAALHFERLTVEYPGGEAAARSLHRLGLQAAARGATERAERYFGALLRDYPDSPLRLEARSWLERRDRGPSDAPRGASGDLVGLAAGSDTVGDEPPSVGAGDYSVQLGAFSSRARAGRLADRVRRAGLEPRVVRVGRSGLIRVRVGRFERESGAERMYGRVVDMGFEATVVSDVPREVPIR